MIVISPFLQLLAIFLAVNITVIRADKCNNGIDWFLKKQGFIIYHSIIIV